MGTSGFAKFCISFLLFNFIFTPIFFSINQQSDLDESGFTSSAIEATAGIVAIVFAISILVVQHAASNYTPSVLSNFKDDVKFWFTLSYSMFTIIFLSFSLVLDWKIFLLDLFFFINTLGLLSVFFQYTFGKINPMSIVKSIENDTAAECKKIARKLKKELQNISVQDKTRTYEYALKMAPSITAHSVLSHNEKWIQKILSNELTIRQIILAATKKGDYDTSRAGLDVYPTIFENYLKIIPQYQWFSDKFLAKLLEDLRSYAVEKIQSTDTIFLNDLFGAIKKIRPNIYQKHTIFRRQLGT